LPEPTKLLKKGSSKWSDSSDSNEKIPKSLAVRGKFIFDPEHGGGRRRRDKHLPRQKNFTDNYDKIGYSDNIRSFKARLNSPKVTSPNPFEISEELANPEP
jgi:hypothetical protein